MTSSGKSLLALVAALAAWPAWGESGAHTQLREAQQRRASIVATVAKCAKRPISEVTIWMAPSFREPGLNEPGFVQSYLRRPEVMRELASKQALTTCWRADLYQAAIEASTAAARAQARLFGAQTRKANP